MSLLFTPKKIGNLEIKNRFVQSATFTASAKPNGEVSEQTIRRHQRLARGEVGLIVKGALFVHPWGKMGFGQAGIHNDTMIPGLKRLTTAVHTEGGKIVFQLHHAGDFTSRKVIGCTPFAPSAFEKDPLYGKKPREMTCEQIQEVIECFGKAAARAAEAGADGVQIHAAHSYLVSKFISPFYNRRTDEWGGTDEKRFRFLKEIFLSIKKNAPGFPVLIKMNSHDHTPEAGMTHDLTIRYAGWLAELGIDALELSSGSTHSVMHVSKGQVPVDELALSMPRWKRSLFKYIFNNHYAGKYDLTGEWHLAITKKVRPILGTIPLFLVGGVRSLENMNQILESNTADFISLCRPLIHEPNLVKKIKEGKTTCSSCNSCNKCLASTSVLYIPLRCFSKISFEKIAKLQKERERTGYAV
jgi:2,4-dienoyl-CoA reductase-like NADH-dependent reductase (Old Yellow Enzyme family)